MPGPLDRSCTHTGEQKLLIHSSVQDGAVHVAPTSHSGREVEAPTQLEQNTLFFGGRRMVLFK